MDSDSVAVITVTPQTCMQDEAVLVKVTGLYKNETYTITSTITDGKGVPFHALVHYQSDDDGIIDLSEMAAIGGHFQGQFPMGLFFNIVPHKSEYKHHRFFYRDVTKPSDFELMVYRGAFAPHISMLGAEAMSLVPECSTTHRRLLLAPGSHRIKVSHGRVRGVLHIPPGVGPFPGIIDMFGSAGGLMEHRSALLAARGIVSLSLAFFAYEDLPKDLKHFELSYFEEAVNYLLSRKEVYRTGVGAIGVSKGGDLVLNMARHIPSVKAGIVINGCASNIESIIELLDGSIMPPNVMDIGRVRMMKDGAMDCYYVLNDPIGHPESQIDVENIAGDILWIVGLDDKNWDSRYLAEIAMNRYKKAGREHKLQIVEYPGAGHLIEPPYTPFCDMSYHKVIQNALNWGGQPGQHCWAQEDAWKRILAFFKEKLTPVTQSKL